jgi:TolB-like protein
VLRKVLSEGDGAHQYIQTIPRRGYRFVGSVRELGYEQDDLIIEEHSRARVVITDQQEATRSSVPGEAGNTKAGDTSVGLPVANLTSPTSRSRSVFARRLAPVAILALLVVGTVVAVRSLQGKSEIAQPEIRSLAVLPLENLSGDPAQDYFADGMTDELIAALAKTRGLRVVSRTSVMRYKGPRNKSLPEIARELNVDAVVEGSVLRSGDRVRITAQLIQATSDRHLWGESYERDLRDTIALQREVAMALTEQIKIKLTPQEQERLGNAHKANPEAHEAYLKGRYFWNKRTEEGLKKGIEYFEQAINLDHDYALAYSGLADCYISLYDYQILPPEDSVPQAKAAAASALKIDNDLAEAHASLAYCSYLFDRDWVSAEKEFLRAIELNPNYATARQWHGRYLADLGRFETISEMRRARNWIRSHSLLARISGLSSIIPGNMIRPSDNCSGPSRWNQLSSWPTGCWATHMSESKCIKRRLLSTKKH